MNKPLIKALKHVNFLSGHIGTEEELKKHRKLTELVGRVGTPKGDVIRTRFRVGKIRCEETKPVFAHNPNYVILYCHGGGYVIGGLKLAGIMSTKLAMATGFTVLSFDYRLAPEHPYPAALEDAVRVWEYLTKDMYAPDHVLVGGDSAGGNLALCLTQNLAAEGKALPRQLLLFSPWTDMTGTAPAYEIHKKDDPILSAEFVLDASKKYILDGDPTDPRFSPLFGDFTNFPPTYIMAGRNGILVDDSIRLKERIEECGGKAVLDIEEKGWHVYPQMPLPMAGKAMERLAAHVTNEIYGKNDRIGGNHGK